MFKISDYTEYLDRFILKMEQIDDINQAEVFDAVGEMCQFLRIGRFLVSVYASPAHMTQEKQESICFYSLEQWAEEGKITKRELVRNGTVTVFEAYPMVGEPEWAEEEVHYIRSFIKLFFALSGRVRSANFIERMIYHDESLDIYTLKHFLRVVEMMMAHGDITSYGACYFNIKRLSIVNQTYGRDETTLLLKQYIHQLNDILEAPECVCRVGSDNFIVLFDKSKLERIKQQLQGVEMDAPGGKERIMMSAHAGFYLITEDCRIPDDIVDRASLALNLAKNVNKVPYVFFDEQIKKQVYKAKKIESMFQSAVKKEEFLVYYQPKYLVDEGKIIGAEALCRWKHDGQMIQPLDFIPILEQSNLICRLDFYILDKVCRDIRRWLDEGRNVVKVSVNLSRVHLGDVNLLDQIVNTIEKYNVPREYIEIELTETTTDVDFRELKHIVSGLNQEGISISVDDFGVGYSSLNLIREIPWSVLKIDKSFLPGHGADDNKKEVMLKHVISMAQDLGMECIVEGVETKDHVELIMNNHCHMAQGFYFSGPLPVEEFEKKLVV